MIFREIAPDEKEHVYHMGHKVWEKGRTYQQYVKDNQKEENYGTRYVYVDEAGKIIGSLIVLYFKTEALKSFQPFFGLGSIVVDEDYHGMGYGTDMLNQCLVFISKQSHDPFYLLYSDIDPAFYRKLGFKELPDHQQRYSTSTGMARGSQARLDLFFKLPVAHIPTYF